MALPQQTVKRKINRAILITSSIVILLTGLAYFTYELLTFRKTTIARISAVGEVISNNSTAALAFNSEEEAYEILSALKSEEDMVAAVLYDRDGQLFSAYPDTVNINTLPENIGETGYNFAGSHLHAYHPVILGTKQIGTLYLQYDLKVLSQQLLLFSLITFSVIVLSVLLAYFLSSRLQKGISRPIIALAEIARSISTRGDYSVRAIKQSQDEIGILTDAFNQMLDQIQQQNQSLSNNQERMRSILEGMGDAFVSLNRDWKYTIVNEKAIALIGKEKEQLLGHTIWEVFPDMAGTYYEEEYHKVMNERLASRFETYYAPYHMWLDIQAYPHEDGIAIFYTDITERKQAEGKLESQLARMDLLSQITRAIGERLDLQSIFQVVIQSLEDKLPVDFGCIGLYDPHSTVLDIKKIGSKSYAFSDRFSILQKKQINIHENKLTKFSNGNLIYEPDVRKADAPFFRELSDAGMISVVVVPLNLENQVFGGLICARKELDSFSSGDCEFLLQLSEHVALAANQANLHDALNKAYNDLKQTQQTVLQQERLRALGQMASGIAHDINNAISPVVLYAESLLETEPGISEKGRKYLEIIQQATEDVASTVSRMREFYRKREPQLSLTEVNLNQLVKQVIELTRVKWYNMPQQKGIVIATDTELDQNLAAVMGVESEIREALTNLVFNGVDAMPDGGTLKFTTRIVEDSNAKNIQQAFLEVTDTGLGMDEATRSRCLEPFYTTKGERGTGLGLAMVYGIMERHSAEIQIESSPGQGTTVRMVFPIKNNLSDTPKNSGIIDQIPSQMTILVIDDDPLLLRSLQDTLELDGHVVTTANGGQIGIDIFKGALDTVEPFQVVITDLGMPYIDGRKVAASIKQLSPDTPIIMLTGWGERIQEEGDVPEHVDYLLSKPPKLHRLREVLAQSANKKAR